MISKPNCSIQYKALTQVVSGEDPITGEPVFTESETEESFRASLEKDTVEPMINVQPGKDKTKQYYSGKACLTPKEMPDWYQPGCQLTILFDNGLEVLGYVYPANISRLGLDDLFGAPIEIALNY